MKSSYIPKVWPAVLAAIGAYKKYGIDNSTYGKGTRIFKRPTTPMRSMQSYRKFKRPFKYEKRKARSCSVSNMCKRVKRLESAVDRKIQEGKSRLSYRTVSLGYLTAPLNKCVTNSLWGCGVSDIETVISNLKVFNPSVPGTFINVDFTSGTQMKEVTVSNITTSVLFRNNYAVPVDIIIWQCKPKSNTSLTPQVSYNNGLADIGLTITGAALDTGDYQCYPEDSVQFNLLWEITKTEKMELKTGEEYRSRMAFPMSFKYDPSYSDSTTAEFQPAFNGHTYLVRVMAKLSHDSAVGTEQGYAVGKVDIMYKRVINISYDGGADFEYILTGQTNGFSFTNGAVCGNLTTPKSSAAGSSY